MEELNILYEDNHIIVVLKPQNVPTCEDDSKDPDLLNMVKDYIKVTYNKPGNVYVGLVHRLDRPTGGVMVFAKSSKAAARLTEQIQNGDFEKRYYAVVCGIPEEDQATLIHYVKKNAVNNMVYVTAPTVVGAKRAELNYKVLEKLSDSALVDVRLYTGRSHQIRVQMSHLGNPVFGDMRYGGLNAVKGNLALFASTLAFTHPVTKERLVFKVEPPKDLTPWKFFDTSVAVKTL